MSKNLSLSNCYRLGSKCHDFFRQTLLAINSTKNSNKLNKRGVMRFHFVVHSHFAQFFLVIFQTLIFTTLFFKFFGSFSAPSNTWASQQQTGTIYNTFSENESASRNNTCQSGLDQKREIKWLARASGQIGEEERLTPTASLLFSLSISHVKRTPHQICVLSGLISEAAKRACAEAHHFGFMTVLGVNICLLVTRLLVEVRTFVHPCEPPCWGRSESERHHLCC